MSTSFSFRPRSVALAAAALATLAVAGTANAVPLIGLTTTNALTMFDSASPMNGSAPVTITGLNANQMIIDIDRRPTNGLLYGLSSDAMIYTLNATTGVATNVAALNSPLSGVAFAIDFNPAADLSGAASLRVTSNNGQNLAVNAGTGAVDDADLADLQRQSDRRQRDRVFQQRHRPRDRHHAVLHRQQVGHALPDSSSRRRRADGGRH